MTITAQQIADLKQDTESYWYRIATDEQDNGWDRYGHYIQDLLPKEVAAAQADGRWLVRARPVELLVLMLGFSIEPLLQSILYYRPRRLMVVYSDSYETAAGSKPKPGHSHYGSFCQVAAKLDHYPGRSFAQPVFEPQQRTDEDKFGCKDAVAVFGFLRRHVIPWLTGPEAPLPRDQVVVDITGAKKSMVTGAYLFATFAGLPVSYVDFDSYDEHYQRPYGYTCRIGELASPSAAFHLDTWRRLRHLYAQSAYDRMADELAALIEQMDGAELRFLADEVKAVERLAAAIDVYRLWSIGDFDSAASAWERIQWPDVDAGVDPHSGHRGTGGRGFSRSASSPGGPGPAEAATSSVARPDGDQEDDQRTHLRDDLLPSAVRVLAPLWKQASVAETDLLKRVERLEQGGEAGLAGSLFGQPDALRHYAHDEMEKVRRLIDLAGDFRSALLRAAGLNELLLKARLVRWWLERESMLTIRFLKSIDYDENSAVHRETLERRIANYFSVKPLVVFLTGQATLDIDKRFDKGNPQLGTAVISLDAAPMKPFWSALDPDRVADLRNKAIHFTVPVPRELADATLAHVQANLADLEHPRLGGTVEMSLKPSFTPPWARLCQACGIAAFLPPDPEPNPEDQTHG